MFPTTVSRTLHELVGTGNPANVGQALLGQKGRQTEVVNRATAQVLEALRQTSAAVQQAALRTTAAGESAMQATRLAEGAQSTEMGAQSTATPAAHITQQPAQQTRSVAIMAAVRLPTPTLPKGARVNAIAAKPTRKKPATRAATAKAAKKPSVAKAAKKTSKQSASRRHDSHQVEQPRKSGHHGDMSVETDANKPHMDAEQAEQEVRRVEQENAARDRDYERAKRRLLIVTGCYHGKTARILIDSGSQLDLVDTEFVDKHQLPVTEAGRCTVCLAGGQTQDAGMQSSGPFKMRTYVTTLTAQVTRLNDYDVILGKPWLTRANPQINWRFNAMQVWQEGKPIRFICRP